MLGGEDSDEVNVKAELGMVWAVKKREPVWRRQRVHWHVSDWCWVFVSWLERWREILDREVNILIS